MDPFEKFWHQEEEIEAAENGWSLASPRQTHDDPPKIPTSDMPPPSSFYVPPHSSSEVHYSSPFYALPPSSDVPPPSSFYDTEKEQENMEVQHDNVSKELKDAENAKRLKLLSTFTEAQMKRYEAFRRSKFNFQAVNRILTEIVETHVPKEISIVVATLGKMFVGELVETARDVMTERNDSGPIKPSHIRESYRRLKLNGRTFKSKSVPRLFR